MSLPIFYLADYNETLQQIILDEETSRHVIQVLRMKIGEELQLTDGKGNLLTCRIIDDHKKKAGVQVIAAETFLQPARKISLAVSPLKNGSRYEWMLEKVAEIGVQEIIPLMCHRTEKQKIRLDRLQNILISAMLQSRQVFLPVLHEPVAFNQVVEQSAQQQKFIAHCEEHAKTELADAVNSTLSSQLMLIGPEGDFTSEEIALALQHHFIPVALGENRLRTETAAVVAATLIKII